MNSVIFNGNQKAQPDPQMPWFTKVTSSDMPLGGKEIATKNSNTVTNLIVQALDTIDAHSNEGSLGTNTSGIPWFLTLVLNILSGGLFGLFGQNQKGWYSSWTWRDLMNG